MEGMKSKKLEYGSKGVMGGHGVAGSWSDGVATDGTRTKHGHGEGTRHKEVGKAGSEEPTKRSLEPIWGVERELRRCGLKAGEDGKRWAEGGKMDRLFPLRNRLNPPFPTCFDASG